MKLATAVRRAVKAQNAEPYDLVACELAVTYAKAIDDGGDLLKYGPLLTDSLDALLMTPAARARALKGARRGVTGSPLDELRDRRAARLHRAETVDPAAP